MKTVICEDSHEKCKKRNCRHSKPHKANIDCILQCTHYAKGPECILIGKKMKSDISVAKAINVLSKALKEDSDYRMAWRANIEMAFKDNWDWYVKKTKKKYINKYDRHAIANDAAEYFIDLLTKK